jgi:DNA-directed RNA polymerase subunit RPC12/RpoP
MAIIKCSKCGKDISDKAIICPHCGFNMLNNSTKAKVNLNDTSEEKKIVFSETHIKKSFLFGKRRSFFIGMVICLLLSVLFGCIWYYSNHHSKIEGYIQYVPFQESEDDNWGMISTDGKVLFEKEFPNEYKLTVVMNDRFIVEHNDNGRVIYEYYTAEKKPKQIGKEYIHAGMFYADVAPVVEEGKPIEFINKDGDVVFKLDKIEGKPVESVTNFRGGLCSFSSEGKIGFINTSGKVVINAKYCFASPFNDGRSIVIDSKYKNDLMEDNLDKVKIDIIDEDGDVIKSIRGVDFGSLRYMDGYNGGYLPYNLISKISDITNGDSWGLLDINGEPYLKANKKIKNVKIVTNNHFGFSDGSNWGLMNTDGTMLIRPKYEDIQYDAANHVWAKEKGKYHLITLDDEMIGHDEFDFISPFYDGHHAIAKDGDNSYFFINEDGKQLNKKDYFNISFYSTEDLVMSDYFDVDNFLNDIGFSNNGIDGLSFTSSPSKVAIKAGNPNADSYSSESYISYDKPYGNTKITIETSFVLPITESITNTEYVNGPFYSYPQTYVVGYRFNNTNVENFYITIPNSGIFSGKMNVVFSNLRSKFDKLGSVAYSSENAIEIKIGNNKTLRMFKGYDRVQINWGSNTYNLDRNMDYENWPDYSNSDRAVLDSI